MLLALLGSPAIAQTQTHSDVQVPGDSRRSGWIVTPLLSIAETYTDNVFLTLKGSEQSDWITQVIPGISVTAKGPRLQLDATYAPEIVYYARTERDDKVFHRGRAFGNLELAEEVLFLEGAAKIDQYDVSVQGTQTTSNVNITGNRATAANAYLSPYLRSALGSSARAEARFTYSTFASDEGEASLPDNDAQRINLSLKSGPAFKVLTWDVAYSGESIKYETQQETTSEVLTADVRRLITTSLDLLAQVGYETYDTGIGFSPLEGQRWRVGFEWTPSPRTRLAATAGQRLDDETYSFEFSHRTRLTTWRATYAEDITTSRSEFFVPETTSTSGTVDQMFRSQYPDPAEREKAVQEFIARTGLPPSLGAPVNFFTDELFLQRRWSGTVGLQGARNTLIASAFWQHRKALTGDTVLLVSGDFDASDSIRMTGGSLAWNLRLTARNAWNLEAGYTRNEFLDSDRVDDFSYLRASITRRFQKRLSGTLTYRRQELDSTRVTTNYVENAGIASLRMTF